MRAKHYAGAMVKNLSQKFQLSQKWQFWQKTAVLGLTIALVFCLSACGGDRPTSVKSKARQTTREAINIAEVSPPVEIPRLNRFFDQYEPQVKFLSPQPDAVIESTQVAVKLDVKDLPIYKDVKLGLGPHVHVILDGQEYKPLYDLSQPLVFDNLSLGTHTLRAFASRPWHESFKNEGAYNRVTFHVFSKTGENTPSPQAPLLTFSRPVGSYGAEPILLDFYLSNAPLHLAALEDESITDWQIRATINGQSFLFDQWQPIYLKGFKPGKNWVRLELLDNKGNLIPNQFNSSAHLITYQPGGQDTLSRLMRGEAASEFDAIANPNYTPETVPDKAPVPVPATPEPQVKTEPIGIPIPIPLPGAKEIAPAIPPLPVTEPKQKELKVLEEDVKPSAKVESQPTTVSTPAPASTIAPKSTPKTVPAPKAESKPAAPNWRDRLKKFLPQKKESSSASTKSLEKPASKPQQPVPAKSEPRAIAPSSAPVPSTEVPKPLTVPPAKMEKAEPTSSEVKPEATSTTKVEAKSTPISTPAPASLSAPKSTPKTVPAPKAESKPATANWRDGLNKFLPQKKESSSASTKSLGKPAFKAKQPVPVKSESEAIAPSSAPVPAAMPEFDKSQSKPVTANWQDRLRKFLPPQKTNSDAVKTRSLPKVEPVPSEPKTTAAPASRPQTEEKSTPASAFTPSPAKRFQQRASQPSAPSTNILKSAPQFTPESEPQSAVSPVTPQKSASESEPIFIPKYIERPDMKKGTKPWQERLRKFLPQSQEIRTTPPQLLAKPEAGSEQSAAIPKTLTAP